MIIRLIERRLIQLIAVVAIAAAAVAVATLDTNTVSADGPVEDDFTDVRQFINDNGSFGSGTDGDSGSFMFMSSDTPGLDMHGPWFPMNDEVNNYTGMSTSMRSFQANPWGCRVKAHSPHESSIDPGLGHVQAKADINCTSVPPPHISIIVQDLSRVAGSSIIIEEVKTSSCPSGDGEPNCHPGLDHNRLMRAYINTPCEIGATYRWIHVAEGRMYVNGTLYSGLSGKARNVECEGP